MADAEHLGARIDALGITANIDDDTLIADIVILIECIRPDGVSLLMAQTPRMSWIKKLGMLTAAVAIENSGYSNIDDQDDDD